MGGKLVVPVLVSLHALFFVFIAWDVASDPRDFSLSIGTSFLAGMISYLLVLSTPMVLLLQIGAQYYELRRMNDFGVLSLRSFSMQGAVMMVVALRLFIKTGLDFLVVAEDDGQGMFVRILLTPLRWYFGGFMSFNYILWAAGATLVYLTTKSSKTEIPIQHAELGVFHD